MRISLLLLLAACSHDLEAGDLAHRTKRTVRLRDTRATLELPDGYRQEGDGMFRRGDGDPRITLSERLLDEQPDVRAKDVCKTHFYEAARVQDDIVECRSSDGVILDRLVPYGTAPAGGRRMFVLCEVWMTTEDVGNTTHRELGRPSAATLREAEALCRTLTVTEQG